MFDRSPQGELAASIRQISRQAIEALWQARGRHARKNVRRGQGRMKWKARPEGSASPSAGTRQGRSESECRRGSRARCSHDRIRQPQRRLRAESKEEGTRHKGPKTTVGLPRRERTTVARTSASFVFGTRRPKGSAHDDHQAGELDNKHSPLIAFYKTIVNPAILGEIHLTTCNPNDKLTIN